MVKVLLRSFNESKLLLKGLPFILLHEMEPASQRLESAEAEFLYSQLYARRLPRSGAHRQLRVRGDDAREGSVSMCLHNANRDLYITKEFTVNAGGEAKVFNPVRQHKRDYWAKKLPTVQFIQPVRQEEKNAPAEVMAQ